MADIQAKIKRLEAENNRLLTIIKAYPTLAEIMDLLLVTLSKKEADADAKIVWYQAIVDKLQTTDDGQYIIPGETYWAAWLEQTEDGDEWMVRPCRYVGHAYPHVDYAWEIEDCPWDGYESPPGFSIWSTKAAADAAKET